GCFWPPCTDLANLPAPSTCASEIEAWDEHLVRLRYLEGMRGWEGGIWQDARKESLRRRRYWELIHACYCGNANDWHLRQKLQNLKDHIGPVDYLKVVADSYDGRYELQRLYGVPDKAKFVGISDPPIPMSVLNANNP